MNCKNESRKEHWTGSRPSRRDFLRTTALPLVAAGLGGMTSGTEGAQLKEGKPNLLFIITDQQRWDALSIAGNEVLETPHLDRLAREGAYFKKAYTPCAVCGPARSSILTGCTVEHTGMNSNAKAYHYQEKGLMAMKTFDEVLAGHGYHCEYYGKWHSQTSHTQCYQNPVKASKQGRPIFDHGGQKFVWLDYLEKREPKRAVKAGEFYDNMSERPYRSNPLDKFHGQTYDDLKAAKTNHVQPDQHGELLMDKENTLTAFQAKQTIAAIKRMKGKPFSLTCSFHFPHSPMLPTKPYYGMYRAAEMAVPVSIDDDMSNSPYLNANGRLRLPEYRDKDKIKYMISDYYGLIKEIDDWVGKILATLEEEGLAKNTLVIFTSDHGEMLGSHGMREKNVFYEESAHIPLHIRFPGRIKEQTCVEGYVSLVDLYETILDYLGVTGPKSDGKSLRGLIEGTDREHGQAVVTEWDSQHPNVPHYMIIKNGWKLMVPNSEKSKALNALYDLNKDPYEMHNLLGKNPERGRYAGKAEELRGLLLEWLKRNGSKYYDSVRKRKLV